MSINVQERVLKIPIPLSGADGSSVEECTLELPPGFPEVHKIVYAEGLVCPEEPVFELGQVILKGTVDIGIIYAAKGGEQLAFKGVEFPKALEYVIPVDLGGEVAPQTQISASVQVESVTASAGKDKTIKCDLVLAYEVEAAQLTETRVLTDITGADLKVNVTKESKEIKSFVTPLALEKAIEASLVLAKADPPIAELLRVGVKPRIDKSRCLAGKVIVEGELDFELLYQPQQPEPPQPEQKDEPQGEESEADEDFLTDFSEAAPSVPKIVKKEISAGAKFMLSQDVSGLKPDMTPELKVAVTGCTAKAVAAEKVEATVLLQAKGAVYEEFSLETVVSAETEGEERVDLNRRLFNVPQTAAETHKELVVTGSPGIAASKSELKDVLSVRSKPKVSQCKVAQDKITVGGKVHLDVLYLGENELGEEVLDSLSIDHGFEFKETFELAGVEPGMLVKVDANVTTAAVNVLDPFTLEANILVTLDIEAVDVVETELVMEAALAVPAPKDGASIRVVVVQKGDTLWKLARQYGTTVEFLAEYNKLEDTDELAVGQRLRIPSVG
ncbi:MAG: DUF3794 domain-containing protein [Firmicutes bacterium]|nr:DUF3794 domain-containing protein [Bacillota bacterium]